jgi:hypothetical protein
MLGGRHVQQGSRVDFVADLSLLCSACLVFQAREKINEKYKQRARKEPPMISLDIV